jgi:hypothetical protein
MWRRNSFLQKETGASEGMQDMAVFVYTRGAGWVVQNSEAG